MTQITLAQALAEMPLIAIIRGVTPDEALAITSAIKTAGFTLIEVPLNSPEPLKSIKLMAEKFSKNMLVGAGTVTTVEQVEQVHQAGGKFIVSPNTNVAVIKRTKQLGMASLPGFYTPSEAFTAIQAGADGLKMFPADTLGTKGLKAMSAVLPTDMPIFAVGGVNSGNMQEYIAVGAAGFGLGSGVYKPGMTEQETHTNAKAHVEAYKKATA